MLQHTLRKPFRADMVLLTDSVAFTGLQWIGTAQGSFTTISSDLHAVISGANAFTVGPIGNLELNASRSFDPDGEATPQNSLFTWTCIRLSDGMDVAAAFSRHSQRWNLGERLSLNTSWFPTTATYRFTVEFRVYLRSATASVDVTLAGFRVPYITIDAPKYVNVHQTNTLKAKIAQSEVGLSYVWEEETSFIAGGIDSILQMSSQSPQIVIRPDVLEARSHMFSVSATSKETGSLGRATVLIRGNVGPLGGTVTVTPNTGFSFQTTFSLATSSWVDEAGQIPFTYTFCVGPRSLEINTTAALVRSPLVSCLANRVRAPSTVSNAFSAGQQSVYAIALVTPRFVEVL
eukprot:jgi/Bigna1/71258/fgenesh1_pg.15_\